MPEPGEVARLLGAERYATGNERFDGLTEQELLRRATRELLIALIVVAEDGHARAQDNQQQKVIDAQRNSLGLMAAR
jgi:hypothetical protein